MKDLRAIDETLDAALGPAVRREARFHRLQASFADDKDPFRRHAARMMGRWAPGLFVGGNRMSAIEDNLDLERWFKGPKSHERRIHGHAHAGSRIVREGPTLLLVLDAHRAHPDPFTEEELRPYRDAVPPADQLAALHRATIMRRARSRKQRRSLLAELERRVREVV